ncbi:MAG: acetolactate decarboxylase [Anaerolineales bacterium]|nr:acetolactate decarboxylase [Anaerolineales bacterium]
MQRKYLTMLLLASLVLLVLAGCQAVQAPTAKSDAIYQVSLLDALLQGDYDGTVPIAELLKNGDTGLGTFDNLDGEMIVLDGVVYRAKSDGSVEVAAKEELVPFAVVGYFDKEIAGGAVEDISDVEALKAALDKTISETTGDFNQYYIATIAGDFDLAHVRSVPRQEEPFKPLAEVTKEQTEFEYTEIPGTLVGLRFPEHMEGINLPGWHFHFLSDDKTKGGHVLDLKLASGEMNLDHIREFNLIQPDTDAFANLDLGGDMSQATGAAESK